MNRALARILVVDQVGVIPSKNPGVNRRRYFTRNFTLAQGTYYDKTRGFDEPV